VRPARQKAALGRRRPALHTENPGNVDSLAVELNDQRVSGEVIAHRCDRQDVRAERRKVVGSVGAASRNNFSFAMLEDQDRRFTRDARNFAILEFIGNEIARRTTVLLVNCSTHSRRARRSTEVEAGFCARERFIFVASGSNLPLG